MNSKTFISVLTHKSSLLVGVCVIFVIFSVVTVVPNLDILRTILVDSQIAFTTKLKFSISLYGSLLSNQTVLSGAIAIATALLSGINAALITYYILLVRSVRFSKRVTFSSLGGFMAGLLGIGCAACGSIIISTALTSTGGAILLLLPLKGAEIGLVGILLLLYATKMLLTEIERGVVCELV